MNMFKYLLLSVVCTCVSVLNAQDPIAAKSEDSVMAKTKESVPAKVETPVEPQPVINDKELAEGQDDDFAEWAKSLEMSDEEKSQFLSEMNDEMDQEVEKMSDDGQTAEGVNSLVDGKSIKETVGQKSSPEVKTVPVKPELPKADK